MTFQEKFDELKAKYGAVDESALGESFAVQINMTEDESHGTFYAAYMNGVFAVEPYDYRDHTAMITVPVATLEAVLSGKADPVAEFNAGKIAVEGNLGHALNLVKLMTKKEAPKPKKPRAKKSAAKKAEDTVIPAEKADAAPKTAKKPAAKKAEDTVKAAEKADEAPKTAKKPAAKKTDAEKAEKKEPAKKAAKTKKA